MRDLSVFSDDAWMFLVFSHVTGVCLKEMTHLKKYGVRDACSEALRLFYVWNCRK
jgi:hypothetical protein